MLSAKSLYKKRSENENEAIEPETEAETEAESETETEAENGVDTDDPIYDGQSEPNEGGVASNQNNENKETEQTESELLTEYEKDEEEQQEIISEQSKVTEAIKSELLTEYEKDEKEQQEIINEQSKEEQPTVVKAPQNEKPVDESKNEKPIETNEQTKNTENDLKETSNSAESNESAEKPIVSNLPDSIKESSNKQPLANDKEEKTTSIFNVNPLYIIIPIVILSLFALVLAVFILYKNDIIFKKKSERNNTLPKSSAVYSPVTQTESKN